METRNTNFAKKEVPVSYAPFDAKPSYSSFYVGVNWLLFSITPLHMIGVWFGSDPEPNTAKTRVQKRSENIYVVFYKVITPHPIMNTTGRCLCILLGDQQANASNNHN